MALDNKKMNKKEDVSAVTMVMFLGGFMDTMLRNGVLKRALDDFEKGDDFKKITLCTEVANAYVEVNWEDFIRVIKSKEFVLEPEMTVVPKGDC